jgi:hypothetical protein
MPSATATMGYSRRQDESGMSTAEADLVDGVPRRRIVVASMIGTTIEFYDFYIYATAAVAVFPHLFFPKGTRPRRCWLRWPRSGWRSSPGRWGQFCSATSATASAARPH